MADNDQKTPLSQSLGRIADRGAANALEAIGKGLPCSIARIISPGIVVVNFEVEPDPYALQPVKMAVAKHPSIQFPMKVGDPGVALSADLRTGALTGLSGAKAKLTDTVGNLSAMTFFWLGHLTEAFWDAEALGLEGNITLTATQLGFFGKPKIEQQALAPIATDTGSCITLANSIRAALIAYGLATGG